MSKLLSLLLASLSVLLLGREIKAQRGLFVTFTSTLNKYRTENSGGHWKPFFHIEDLGWTLGKGYRNDLALRFTIPVNISDLNPLQLKEFTLPPEKKIKCISIGFMENVNDVRAFLMDGGLGQKFASVVVKVPVASTDINLFYALVHLENN